MKTLASVERAAAKAAVAHEGLERAIREAHAKGASLRAIAAAAKMSHEKVRGLIRADQA